MIVYVYAKKKRFAQTFLPTLVISRKSSPSRTLMSPRPHSYSRIFHSLHYWLSCQKIKWDLKWKTTICSNVPKSFFIPSDVQIWTSDASGRCFHCYIWYKVSSLHYCYVCLLLKRLISESTIHAFMYLINLFHMQGAIRRTAWYCLFVLYSLM